LFNGPLLGPIPKNDTHLIHPGPLGTTLSQSATANPASTPTAGSSATKREETVDYLDHEYDILHEYMDESIRKHKMNRRQSGYWLETVGSNGVMPLAPSNYTFFRNVMDYGATGDGTTDDTAAINLAVSSGNRCGNDCGSTSVLGALVYFPPGNYSVSSPIIQYYYTQFVGDPTDPPTLTSTYNFTGIAIIDSDVYIPGGNGSEWYLNQNNFYRQIRNINFDMTAQAPQNTQNYQVYVPTGVHWQGM